MGTDEAKLMGTVGAAVIIRAVIITYEKGTRQGRTDNSWDPRAIGDHGAPVSLPKLKKAYEKGIRGISWSPY
ncbi:unnamed protein product [Staurois parvus]|uniref:Uncharacterized protein n=1 Tax=Staurois parvus TaxID=386267 RepID=A0ABN9H570_9NEOB|nr:unnamed protein product [Staurois parvus]